MKRNSKYIWTLAVVPALLIHLSHTVRAQDAVPAEQALATPQTAAEIRGCARNNFPRQTSVQNIVMVAHDRSGGERTLRAKMYWRLDKDQYSNVMIRVDSPADLSGSSYLVLEGADRDDMFMFLPALNRVRRILGNMKTKPLWGTDLSYEDVKQLQGVAQAGEIERLDDARLGEREVYVLQTTYDDSEESAYSRVVTHIDRATCMPLQVDFFDLADKAVKQLNINPDTLVEVNGRWQMRDLEMRDLHNESRTELKVEEIESDESISNRVFNSHTFYRGG